MEGKHVLIPGGTGGLGQHVARAALARGAKVTVPYIAEREVERMAGLDVTLVHASATDEAGFRAVVEGMPQVDVLLQLVGGFTMGPTDALALDDFRAHIELTLTSTFVACKWALRAMKKTGYGRIVTVGSRAAVEPAAQMAAYSAAKAGVVAMTRAIAEETRDLDITANCVLPSVIDTPANRAAMGDDQAHKWVTPQSLAEIICFLGSKAAGDLRGAAVPAYGRV